MNAKIVIALSAVLLASLSGCATLHEPMQQVMPKTNKLVVSICYFHASLLFGMDKSPSPKEDFEESTRKDTSEFVSDYVENMASKGVTVEVRECLNGGDNDATVFFRFWVFPYRFGPEEVAVGGRIKVSEGKYVGLWAHQGDNQAPFLNKGISTAATDYAIATMKAMGE